MRATRVETADGTCRVWPTAVGITVTDEGRRIWLDRPGGVLRAWPDIMATAISVDGEDSR